MAKCRSKESRYLLLHATFNYIQSNTNYQAHHPSLLASKYATKNIKDGVATK